MTQLQDQSPPPVAEPAGRDNPEAYIPRDRRRALGAGVDLPDRVAGAALFADISGFTPLTEALAAELGPQRGAEELTINIGRVFHAVIDELDRRGGDVIYFSGDAITCWIDGDDGLLATAAALAMQEAIERVGRIVTPAGTTIQLGMKVAVAVGSARRFLVGDPDIQLIDVLAGRLIDALAEAEHHAERGDVVLEASAVAALGERVLLRERRTGDDGSWVGVVDGLSVVAPLVDVVEPPALPEELVRPWLLPAVYERLQTGRGEFLAELRPAYPVFVRFGGIDYDEDDGAIRKLDEFVRRAQRILAGYGGNVLQLTLGDKGAYLYGVFGSPIAHEDDAARAAAAALEVRDLEATTSARDIQVGIGYGRLRSGTYGHAMRRTFVCLGDAVNLAARLMSKAPAGLIYVSDPVRQAAGDAFIWERLPDLALKGKSAPIAAHALGGSLERASRRRLRFELPLAGRTAELGLLDDRLAASLTGRGRIVAISSEAGMGKSRLVAEFVRSARRSGLTVAFGECQSFGATTPYVPWHEIWRRLLGVDDGSPRDAQLAALRNRVAAIDDGLAGRVPLLEPVVGIEIPDTDLTAGFDAKLRKASLEDLLGRCLRGLAAERPLVLVVEDCHWIDELSRDLLAVLARAAASLPVLIVLAYRPASAPGGELGLERLPSFEEISLAELDRADAARVIRAKLEQVIGPQAEAPEALVELVTERSEGNPFYIEELISYVAGQGVDLADAAALGSLQLPASLHSLVLSRIDTVPEEPRRTLKVASVVGRVFRAPVLPEVYPELGSLGEVREQLATLGGADLVRLDREADEAYLFKHVVTQEVAYESMPFAVRSSLHGLVGSWIERSAADTLDQQLDLLAHHYSRSNETAKKIEYLGRAAEAAEASYANTAAIDYLDRLLPLLEPGPRVQVALKLARILTLVGNWSRAGDVALDARGRAAELGDRGSLAWADVALAEVARKQGRFDETSRRLANAAEAFRAIGDDAGVGRALHLAGTVAAQQGAYDEAEARYTESAAIRERIGDRSSLAAVWTNLGIVAEYRADLEAARGFNARAVELQRAIGDRWGVANSLNNLAVLEFHEGRHEAARAAGEESVRLLHEIGDRQMLAIARHTLGNALRALGDLDGARDHLAAALGVYRELDDRWSLNFLLEDIGVLAAALVTPDRAFELIGAADALREETGTPRAPSLDAELGTALGPTRAVLGDELADAAAERGRALGLERALDLAATVCRADRQATPAPVRRDTA